MNQEKNDLIININNGNDKIKFRIVKYKIDNKYHYLGTTIFNKNINYLKKYYWKRWKIEINFRHLGIRFFTFAKQK